MKKIILAQPLIKIKDSSKIIKSVLKSNFIKMHVIVIMGSEKDRDHVKKITDKLDIYEINWCLHVASAHKNPQRVLEILDMNMASKGVLYITVAGRSNALSGFVAANSVFPTIACPPFVDKLDMIINIQSTLQMPSETPVLTVLDPGNCALAVKRIRDSFKK